MESLDMTAQGTEESWGVWGARGGGSQAFLPLACSGDPLAPALSPVPTCPLAGVPLPALQKERQEQFGTCTVNFVTPPSRLLQILPLQALRC